MLFLEKNKMKKLVWILCCITLLFGCSTNTRELKPAKSDIKIMIATDLHYLADACHDGGSKSVEVYDARDGKVTEYGKEVIMANIREAEKRFIEIQVENDNNYLSKIEAEGGTIVELTQAEKDIFEKDLYNDAIRMGESKETNVINYEFFKRVDAILQKHRGR